MKVGARSELTSLLGHLNPSPAELRRIAELTEGLYGDGTARPWWEKAARAGDEDAVDYLAVLDDERAAGGHGEEQG